MIKHIPFAASTAQAAIQLSLYMYIALLYLIFHADANPRAIAFRKRLPCDVTVQGLPKNVPHP